MFDDLDTNPMDSVGAIKAAAHIVNGGDAGLVRCVACRGSGKFVSYSGRTVGNCFKCKGSGKVSTRVAGAAKAKVTKENNRLAGVAAFRADHSLEYGFMVRCAEFSPFYASLVEKLNEYGSLTDNQLAAVRNGMVKADLKREASKPLVDVSAIEALFANAKASGLKRLAFRTMEIDISAAKETSANAGALYVKHNGEYVGKIASGKFHATYAAKADTFGKVLEVAADPLGMARFYGKQTGNCSCCGRELTDPVSVERGIGPICETKWGF